jgi:hypothetical protein
MPIFLINILIGIALSIASTLIQQALSPKQDKSASGYRATMQTGGKVPLSFLVGTIGVPGKLEYRNTWGEVDGTPNAYLVDVISFGDLGIHAFTGLFVNGQPVTVSATGHVTQGYPVAEYNKSSTDHLWWEFKDGSQTTANTYLTGKFGSDADRPWLSDMIGRQVPYLTLTALINDGLWTGFPSYMGVFQGIPLYDPRLDSTAGGSGSHRFGTWSTYTFSDNPMVIAYNIARGIHDSAGTFVWGGRYSAYQLPYAEWAAAMNACDTAVTLNVPLFPGVLTEKRFRAGREIFVNEVPADVIKELFIGANARIAPTADGKLYPLVGVPSVADGSFTDADVIVSEATTLEPFPNLDSIINGATATYMEPSQGWEFKETAPYYNATYETSDDSRRQVVGLSLNTTFSGTQAQRIIKAAVLESRRFVRHVVPLPPVFGIYRPLQVLSWTSTANGYTSKLFLITARTEAPNGNVILGLQEIDPTDHDWVAGTDEQPLTFAPLTPVTPPAQAMTGWMVAPYTFPDPAGTGRRIGIEVSYAGGLHDVRAVRIQVREAFGSDNTVFDSGQTDYDIADANPVTRAITWAGILPATNYEARGILLPKDGSGRDTDWSAWLAVTTDDVGLSLADLGIDITAWQAQLSNSVREAHEALQRINGLVADAAARGILDRKTLREEMSANFGDLTANYTRTVDVLVTNTDAMAIRVETLTVSTAANLASAVSAIEVDIQSGDAVNASAITALDVSTAAALASAVSTLNTSISAGDTVNATAITALQGQLGNTGANAVFKMDVTHTPSAGWTASAALQVATTAGGTVHDAGIYLEAKSGSSRVVLAGDQIVITDGTNIDALFQAGTTYIQIARIKNADITTAKIGDLQITTAKIGDNAVTTSDFAFTSTNTTFTTETTIQTKSFTPANGVVLVKASAGIVTSGSNGTITTRLKRAGTLVSAQSTLVRTDAGCSVVLFYIDTSPGTSAISWTLTAECLLGPTGNANQRYIECLNLVK